MAARISLNGAPIVVAKRKTINVRMGGDFSGNLAARTVGKKDILTVDMSKQGLSDIQYLLRHITIEEAVVQERLKNPASRLAVDNVEGKPLHAVERKTEVIFGNELEQSAIEFVERSLMNAIRSLSPKAEHKALGTMSSWEWIYVEDPTTNKEGVKLKNTKGLKAMRAGAYLVLKPKSTMAGVANMYAARAAAGWPESKFDAPGSSGGKGFIAQSIDRMKRGNLLKSYTIYGAFTKRFKVPGEQYRESSNVGAVTPVLVLKAKRNRRYKRIR